MLQYIQESVTVVIHPAQSKFWRVPGRVGAEGSAKPGYYFHSEVWQLPDSKTGWEAWLRVGRGTDGRLWSHQSNIWELGRIWRATGLP